ncbi:MAG: tRNA pseudouridine(38-40) synthase TruA [Alphaproteobacteria bacterium]|nr:tRNA pseudouridine(38-40) synthase TruA [Alphaproteobacteria bacterium]
MPRYALKIEYNGAPFAGWQRQKNAPSVQQALEEALRALDPGVPTIFAAGRTDTGVHATGQVAHCEMTRAWDGFRLQEALNYHLRPAPIAVLQVHPVTEEFHARFSALERHYVFRLISRRPPLTHDKGLAWRVNHALDLTAMQNAARHLIGKHDFTTFRASQCQAKSPVKTMDQITISRHKIPEGQEFRLEFRARSFLHNQVRSFVGTLERVGAGAWPPERVKTALEARDRAACGPVCPPDGLYLSHVGYPKNPFS